MNGRNASSLPPRLPELSGVLKELKGRTKKRYTIVAVSYRGYWTSRGRPTQRGIERDAAAALRWVEERYSSVKEKTPNVVLWGQSIGAGVATVTAARSLTESARHGLQRSKILGFVLETPFTSIRDMLVTLYPQRWLPYRYLGALLWNWWDSKSALSEIGQRIPAGHPPHVLILQAGQDEVVPSSHGVDLEELCRRIGLPVQRKEVPGALHSEAMLRSDGKNAVVEFISTIS